MSKIMEENNTGMELDARKQTKGNQENGKQRTGPRAKGLPTLPPAGQLVALLRLAQLVQPLVVLHRLWGQKKNRKTDKKTRVELNAFWGFGVLQKCQMNAFL